MRSFLFLFSSFILFSCSNTAVDVKKPKFLIGKWHRIDKDVSKFYYETWDENLNGVAYNLQGKDTLFKEILHFETQNDSTFLVVTGVNETPTKFLLTQQTDTSFVCENPKHDFPKTITYWLSNNLLNAKVYNENLSIDFIFEKMKSNE